MFQKMRSNKKGFTLLEVIFVVAITVGVVGAINSGWMLTHKVMRGEPKRTALRTDMMTVLEQIRSDIRRSDVNFM